MLIGGSRGNLYQFQNRKTLHSTKTSTPKSLFSNYKSGIEVLKCNENDDEKVFIKDDWCIIIKGQINNRDLNPTFYLSLINIIRSNAYSSLASLSGQFTIIVISSIRSKTWIITDRYGLNEVFITAVHDKWMWATDLKCFLGLKDFNLSVNKDAINCFIYSGQLIGQLTWFENVKLLNGSTVLEINHLNERTKDHRYWSWGQIKKKPVNEREAVEISLDLFKKSIHYCIDKSTSPGILLSGGRDSSALMMACQKGSFKESFTFDYERKKEALKAAVLSKKMGTNNESLIISESNWAENKSDSVILTSCGLSILHFHFSPFLNRLKKSSVLFNGIPGELNYGGYYIDHPDTKINKNIIKNNRRFQFREEHLEYVDFEFFDFDCIDPFYLDVRVRRFTMLGIKYLGLPSFTPFMDVDLNDYLYSLPDGLRIDRRIYNKVIKRLQQERNVIESRFISSIKAYYLWLKYGDIKLDTYVKAFYEKEIKKYIYLNDYEVTVNKDVPEYFTDARKMTVEIWLRSLFNND